jgi:nucleoside-diphosphate-sugar epimerase
MNKIIVTGGSGFIGTNLVQLLIDKGNHVINYDIAYPRNELHFKYWKKVDILDRSNLINNLFLDLPDYIIHLAARTDLDELYNIDGYQANITGVKNIMDGASNLKDLKKIIIASSMLVCKLGYNPISFDDYCPNSLYGESKVLTEKIVKEYDLNWTIIRPTSIWGPWFGSPYKDFFELVLKGYYFNIPSNYAATKTYGYVENTCLQIYSLTFNNSDIVKHNYFYLGDSTPINITLWANKIRRLNNQSNLVTFSKKILIFFAFLGDFIIKYFGVKKFPMTTFRYRNMTNDNVIKDIDKTLNVTDICINTNFDQQILNTINWLKSKKI